MSRTPYTQNGWFQFARDMKEQDLPTMETVMLIRAFKQQKE